MSWRSPVGAVSWFQKHEHIAGSYNYEAVVGETLPWEASDVCPSIT